MGPPDPKPSIDPAVGDDIRVNSTTKGEQRRPHVARNEAGSFVVVWQSKVADADRWDTCWQRFDASGKPQGDEGHITTKTPGNFDPPRAAMDRSGNFVIAWSGDDGASVFAQRYSAAGQALGDALRGDSTRGELAVLLDVAMGTDGGFIITWALRRPGTSHDGFAQRFGPDGSRRGGEFRINTMTLGTQHHFRVAINPSGGFIIAWYQVQREFIADEGFGTRPQRFRPDGSREGSEFWVNTEQTAATYPMAVRSDSRGNFAVAWVRLDQGVFFRRFDASGTPLDLTERRVHSPSKTLEACLAMGADGRFLIAWTAEVGDGVGPGVIAQRYDADGKPRGNPFRVNTTSTGRQEYCASAMDKDGNAVIVWSGNGPDDDQGIFMKLVPQADR